MLTFHSFVNQDVGGCVIVVFVSPLFFFFFGGGGLILSLDVVGML